ncbi:NAD(P)-dependent oxidoreductase [Erythrobacter sp. SD-21]|uniref:NAD-dependent epimerase/dehydratase family protein n=1 Tax=Erythrobacter sp. SD-21 TaxID=161528 RepID=UPI000153FD34|nr:NAD-dependent epimerase/dehydratase family protein [Erythrobacter sp. SD-21]EDL48858.1 predicted nucleoside-diphosphate-sugar epimerase [Erythrobacter sp. SD-21]
MIVALTGATGFVGQAVLDAAERQGIEVRALTRRSQAPRRGVTWVEGSLADGRSLKTLCDGAASVIHVAGLTNTPDPAEFKKANVEGTRKLLAAATQCSAGKRFVFISSLSAREPSLSRYGSSKAHAEAYVETSGLDFTIVRPPAVYGPRDKDMFELFRSAKYGVVPVPPQGHTSIIHVDDLAECLLALSPPGVASGATLEPDDGKPGGYEHGELARLIGKAVGRKVFAPHLPAPILKLAARGDRLLRGDEAKLTADRVGYMVHADWVCRPDRAVPDAVWNPRIPGAEGLAQTARWYEREGWL